jgi:hypothetical protein
MHGANLLVAAFCAFALLALIHGPDGVSADVRFLNRIKILKKY